MYKQASKQKLRYQTNKGLLTTEQLWDLSITELDRLAVILEEDYDKSKGKSFISVKSEKDAAIKLRFDIVLDILNTKVDEAEKQRAHLNDKEHNEKILSLINKKKESSLENLSVEELEKQLRN